MGADDDVGYVQMYPRYGGTCQMSPLNEEEQLYDDTCRKLDDLEQKLRGQPMSRFMAGEFLWFSWYVNKTHFFPKQERLDAQLKTLSDLLEAVSKRP